MLAEISRIVRQRIRAELRRSEAAKPWPGLRTLVERQVRADGGRGGGERLMPIKPENRSLYPGGSPTSPEWKALRARILEREGHACKTCRAPNHQWITRGQGRHAGTYMLPEGDVFDADTGERLGAARGSEYNSVNMLQVILTIAHIDQDPTNNDDDNLAALCQRCHNRLDAPHRAKNAARTRHAKKASDDLFGYDEKKEARSVETAPSP
jgi:5-methylcytosine-specific restriction endonuclease McrA